MTALRRTQRAALRQAEGAYPQAQGAYPQAEDAGRGTRGAAAPSRLYQGAHDISGIHRPDRYAFTGQIVDQSKLALARMSFAG